MTTFLIAKSIEIDAGHRVPLHGSKCKSFHGHRYKVEAFCSGRLNSHGEQSDMVMDFGFLKKLMVEVIDEFCDHGIMLSLYDEYLLRFLMNCDLDNWQEVKSEIEESVRNREYWSSTESDIPTIGKIYVIDNAPTAECLAKHWFRRLSKAVEDDQGKDLLSKLRVWETPTCYSEYPMGV